jgi:hypothetical protein
MCNMVDRRGILCGSLCMCMARCAATQLSRDPLPADRMVEEQESARLDVVNYVSDNKAAKHGTEARAEGRTRLWKGCLKP